MNKLKFVFSYETAEGIKVHFSLKNHSTDNISPVIVALQQLCVSLRNTRKRLLVACVAMTCTPAVHYTNMIPDANDLCMPSSSLGVVLAALFRCNLEISSVLCDFGVFKITVWGCKPGSASDRFLKLYCSGLIVVHL